MARTTRPLALAVLCPLLLLPRAAPAKLITVTPNDDYHAIEAAQAGDVVEIAPGTYKFRVSLTSAGTAAAPITIRAQDPQNRPVWDLTGMNISAWPGSYTAGDKGRGCWQVRGGHYRIQDLVIRGCVDTDGSAVRIVNVPDVHLSGMLLQKNTNGVIGAGDDIEIAFSEFDGNGLSGPPANHQLYIYGGTLDVRYSYFHDSPTGQNFHVRSRDAVLAYNWLTRPGSYPGDLMTCNYFCGGTGAQAITQRMLLLGNVIVQGTPSNTGQIVALLKDEAGSYDNTGNAGTLVLTMLYNTVIGTPKAGAALVHMRNDTIATQVHLSDNATTHLGSFTLVQAPGSNNYIIDGAANWATTGTQAAGLTGTRTGADPMLSAGYVPLPGSPLLGAATPATQAPTDEYYRDEQVKLMGRQRATALDVGAFESTTQGAPFGEEGPPGGDGGAPADLAGDTGADGGGPGGPGEMGGDVPGPGGCSCRVSGQGGTGDEGLLAGAGLLLAGCVLLRRRPRATSTSTRGGQSFAGRAET